MKHITTTQLAKKLNVSNSSILQHFNKLSKEMKKHSNTNTRTRYYDSKAVSAIIKSYQHYQYHKANSKFNEKLSTKLMESTIKRQASEIKTLHKLLNHQQELNLNTQNELNDSQKQFHQLQLSYHARQTSNHGFWWKLFH